MKICILGNSRIFIDIVRKHFAGDEIEILGWRDRDRELKFYDAILVCGLDRGVYLKPFRACIYDGYMEQLIYIARLLRVNRDLRVYYVNTLSSIGVSASRYELVKNRLALKLERLGNFRQIAPTTIVNDQGVILHANSRIYALGIRFLIRCSVLKTCTPKELEAIFLAMFRKESAAAVPTIRQRYYLVRFPRPPIVDKLLKLFVIVLQASGLIQKERS